MKLFETFNFDIIIVLVLIASVFLGMYHSLYRQARRTAVLVLPSVFLFFAFERMISLINNFAFAMKLKDSIFGFFASMIGKSGYTDTLYQVTGYFTMYIGLAIVISLLYRLIRIPTYKKVLNKPGALSRIIGATLGLISGYMIVILLMYAVKPIINVNYDRPIAKVISETNNPLFSFTMLNQYQYTNIDRFQEYQEIIDTFTGRKIYEEYSEISKFLNTYPEDNEYLKNSVVPLFSDVSKQLLPTESDGDYIKALIGLKDGDFLYRQILKNEKKNGNYPIILKNYTDLIRFQGLITMANLPDSDIDIDSLYLYLTENRTAIADGFYESRFRNAFLGVLADYEYYQNHKDEFYSFLPDAYEKEPSSFETVFTDINEFKKLRTDFYTAYQGKTEDPILLKLLRIFETIDKYDEQIQAMPVLMSLPCKLVFVKEYKNWFERKTWVNNVLTHTFISETLTQDSISNELYHEYFFFSYLGSDFKQELVSMSQINSVLTKLDQAVANGILTEQQAIRFMEYLLLNNHSVFRKLEDQKIINADIYQEIATTDNKYISPTVKEELPNF